MHLNGVSRPLRPSPGFLPHCAFLVIHAVGVGDLCFDCDWDNFESWPGPTEDSCRRREKGRTRVDRSRALLGDIKFRQL
jgi:hypothetical protein